MAGSAASLAQFCAPAAFGDDVFPCHGGTNAARAKYRTGFRAIGQDANAVLAKILNDVQNAPQRLAAGRFSSVLYAFPALPGAETLLLQASGKARKERQLYDGQTFWKSNARFRAAVQVMQKADDSQLFERLVRMSLFQGYTKSG